MATGYVLNDVPLQLLGAGRPALSAKQQGKTLDQRCVETGVSTGLIESIGGIGASQVKTVAGLSKLH